MLYVTTEMLAVLGTFSSVLMSIIGRGGSLGLREEEVGREEEAGGRGSQRRPEEEE